MRHVMSVLSGRIVAEDYRNARQISLHSLCAKRVRVSQGFVVREV